MAVATFSLMLDKGSGARRRTTEATSKSDQVLRKFSVDVLSAGVSGGILKRTSLLTNGKPRINKSVSFSEQENICFIEKGDGEERREEDDKERHDSEADDHSPEYSSNKFLIPAFICPDKRPNFEDEAKQKVVLLENIRVTEDLNLIGTVRVNVDLLTALTSKWHDHGQRQGLKVCVLVVYSTDGWTTRHDCLALLLRPVAGDPQTQRLGVDKSKVQPHACLFRFVLDCSHLEVGQSVEFTVWCVERNSSESLMSDQRREKRGRAASLVNFEDDNGRQFYRVSCVHCPNPWARRAALQLNN